MVYSTLGLKQL